MEGVGARAVVGVVVVAALVGLGIGLLLQGGGDDGESTSSSDASTEPAEEESEGTGEFEAESGDELPVELAAGDALRVVVEGGDVQLYLAASEDAQTDGFEDLEPRNQVALGGDLDVGLVFLATDRSSDDVEGLQFVAPTAGTYTVLLIGPGSFGSDEDLSLIHI